MALTRPTTTPLPDEIFDEWAPLLGEAELKVLLYIVRRTLGFRKGADAISLTQFASGITTRDGRVLDRGCGITSRATLVRALKSLEEKGLIHMTKERSRAGDRAVTVYALSWDDARSAPAPGGSRAELPGTHTQPGWFAAHDEVVLLQNHRGSRREPTTNSPPTNSQQNSMTQRAPACRSISAVGTCAVPVTASDGHALWQAIVDDL